MLFLLLLCLNFFLYVFSHLISNPDVFFHFPFAGTYELDLQGPVFSHEPPHKVEFSNSTGGHIECSGHGSPQPEVSKLFNHYRNCQNKMSNSFSSDTNSEHIICQRNGWWKCVLVCVCLSVRTIEIEHLQSDSIHSM